jgi:hypothetical protein
MAEDSKMTKWERQDLMALARKRERVALDAAAARAAQMRADGRAMLAQTFSFEDDPVWQQMHEEATRVERDFNAAIQKRCKEAGIPKSFRPSVTMYFRGRGENAVTERRQELTQLLNARVDEMLKAAKFQITSQSADVQTKLVAAGLTSEQAQAFLREMPTAEQLMPSITPTDVALLFANKIARDNDEIQALTQESLRRLQ